jgi:hypothetical protein
MICWLACKDTTGVNQPKERQHPVEAHLPSYHSDDPIIGLIRPDRAAGRRA